MFCNYPFWGKSSFVASIEDAKPVWILNWSWYRSKTGFVPAPKPALCHRYTCCTKTGFVPMLNQPLQNRLCACSKTGLAPMLNLPHQNRLCAYAKPTAPKPALCCVRLQNLPWYKTCLGIKTGFASSIEASKLDLLQNRSIQNMFSIQY